MDTSSLHVDYKHATIKQYHKENRALRTETTINDIGLDRRKIGLGTRLLTIVNSFSAPNKTRRRRRLSYRSQDWKDHRYIIDRQHPPLRR